MGAVLVAIGVAHPHRAAAQAAPERWDPPRGAMELELRGGAGWFLDTSAPGLVPTQRVGTERLGPGPLGEFRFGGRVTRWLSVGGHFVGQAFMGGQLPATLADGGAGMVLIGPDARFYLGSLLRWRWIDPWVMAGIDPFAQIQLGNHLAGGVGSTGQIQSLSVSVGGVAFPVAVGLDVNITRIIAVGVLARIAPFVPVTRCLNDPSQMTTTTVCSGNNLSTETSFSVAGGVRVVLPN